MFLNKIEGKKVQKIVKYQLKCIAMELNKSLTIPPLCWDPKTSIENVSMCIFEIFKAWV